MHTTIELLDMAKARHEVSDYKLAQLLGVVPSAVKNYRAGRSHPDQNVCTRLAELLDLDPDVVFCNVQAERFKDDSIRTQWERISARLEKASGVVAAVIFSVLFSGWPDGGAQASTLPGRLAPTHISGVDGLYIRASNAIRKMAVRLGRLANGFVLSARYFEASNGFA